MTRRNIAGIVGCMGLVVAGFVAFATPAEASVPLDSKCSTGWYVNDDEASLMPDQTEDGLVFDGPSLIHHATDYSLGSAPNNGSFTSKNVTGVKPLFKMETSAPYSTVNKTSDGKFWSSKVPAGTDGAQDNPVSSLADLVGKWNYTSSTRVSTFGVGYANDTGNKATVTSITFGSKTYDMTCKPKPTPTATSTRDCMAYVFTGTKENLCKAFAGASTATKATCAQIKYRVTLVNAKNDPWGLDGSGGNVGTVGVGCESNPLKPRPTPTATRTSAAPVGVVGAGPSLPVTGPPIGVLVGVGALILVAGVGAIVLTGRRKRRFTA